MSRKAAIITVFDPYAFKGGIETYTIQLISLLKTKGIEITVYHTGLLNKDDPVREITLGHKLIEDVYHIGRRVLAEQYRYDLIISNSFYGMGYFPPMVKAFNIYHSTYAGYIQKFKDENIQNPYFYFQYLCEEMGEYISGYNRKKIAVSDTVKEELESIYGFMDVEVVYSGIDTGIFKREENRENLRKRLKIPSDAFVGIFVGRWRE